MTIAAAASLLREKSSMLPKLTQMAQSTRDRE